MAQAHGLIGYSGFVGSNLLRQRTFQDLFNSRNIDEIRGRHFDVLVCAGAPATMWAANRDPDADAKNLRALSSAVRETKTERLVLISSVAVFDRCDFGYTEDDAGFETEKAYGRNRRELEMALSESAAHVHIIRLPALFGPGLKKNFIFDILNPVPSFITAQKRDQLRSDFIESERGLFDRYFALDQDLGMFKLDREAATINGDIKAMERAHRRVGFEAKMFTNSASRYQYFNVGLLSDVIDTCIANDLDVLNICSDPITAKEIHRALTGDDFVNEEPPMISENVKTIHAKYFGESGDYAFRRSTILRDLLSYVKVYT